MPLDTAIGRVFALYRPIGRHGHRFWRKISSCGVVKSLIKASVKKHEMDPLLSSSKQQQQAAMKGRTSRLKPKSTANFLAIKL
jgi:hypothetical protein